MSCYRDNRTVQYFLVFGLLGICQTDVVNYRSSTMNRFEILFVRSVDTHVVHTRGN